MSVTTLFALTAALWAGLAAPAQAAPILAFFGIASIGAAVTAVVNAVVSYVVTSTVASFFTKLIVGKPKAAPTQRRADVTRLQLGEQPRQAVLGRALVAGSLIDAGNYGPNNEGEWLLIAVADHACHRIVGWYLNDTYHPWGADGVQSVVPRGRLRLYTGYGGPQVPPPARLLEIAPGWSGQARLIGVTYLLVDYTYDPEVWTNGRPQVRLVLEGAKLYDPRFDSTVPGGDGPQRWADENTWAWSDNLKLCELNYQWGIHTRDGRGERQLMVGPGKSQREIPPADQLAAIAVCDEPVALKAGGTEPRYRASAVISANERHRDVLQDFAAACGGELVDRGGVVTVEPGAARALNPAFTDDDLLRGAEIRWTPETARDRLVNTVAARYVEPAQLWQPVTAPLRRSADDVAADGEVREASLTLDYVTSQTQAQRVAEIYRRRARLQAAANVTLGPLWCGVECADWQPWQSARLFGGAQRVFQAAGVTVAGDGRTTLALREIAASCYAWDPAVDELDARAPAYLPAGARAALRVEGFTLTPGVEPGVAGASVPVLRLAWTPITDPACTGLLAEWRAQGAQSAQVVQLTPSAGAGLVTVGLADDVDYEVRLVPQAEPGRQAEPTAWRAARTQGVVLAPVQGLSATPTAAGARLTWLPSAQPEVVGYQVRLAQTPTTPWADAAVLFERWPGPDLDVPLSAPDAVTLALRAVDRFGRQSVADARVTVAPADPADVPSFEATPSGDTVRFVVGAVAGAASYEVRAGQDWSTGRLVDRFAGASASAQWPIRSEADGLFWVKARSAAGKISANARLAVARLAAPVDRNVILERDFGLENWDGTRHDLDLFAGLLELVRVGGVSRPFGDYYDDVALPREFRGRAWLEARAAAIVGDSPAWDSLADLTWEAAGLGDWQPPLADAGAATLDAWIAPNTTALASTLLDGWRLDGIETGVRGAPPSRAVGLEYGPCRTGPGARTGVNRLLAYDFASTGGAGALVELTDDDDVTVLTDDDGLTQLADDLTDPAEFSLSLDFRPEADAPATDVALATFTRGDGAWLQLFRRALDGALVLARSDGVALTVPGPAAWTDDTVTVCVSQRPAGPARLTLYAASRRQGELGQASLTVGAVAAYARLHLGAPGEGAGWTWDSVGAAADWDSPAAQTAWDLAADRLGAAAAPAAGVVGDVELHGSAAVAAAFPVTRVTKAPVGFDAFRPFYSGDYTFTRAVVQLRISSPSPVGQRLSIPEAVVNVDVPDVIDRGSAAVIAGPTEILFTRTFFSPPDVVGSQLGGEVRAVFKLLGVTTSGFVCGLYDVETAAPVAGQVSFAAVGY